MADGPGTPGPAPGTATASPQAAPGDQFLCDDEHHNGAFRLSPVFQYLAVMGRAKEFTPFDYGRRDLYEWFLDLGPLSNVNARHFHGKVSGWNDLVEHPDYDRYWRERALPPRLGRPRVPTLHVIGWWDQEDFSGPLRIYEAFEKHDRDGLNSLVAGPWNHGGWIRSDGDRLGPVTFGSPTARDFRDQVMAPWFARHLKDKDKDGPAVPEARVFRTGENAWRTFDHWPPREARRAPSTPAPGAGWRSSRRRPPRTATPVSTPTSPTPPTRSRSAPADRHRHHLRQERPGHRQSRVGRVAGAGPAVRAPAPGCPQLRDNPAGAQPRPRRADHGPAVRLDLRDRLRLGRQADRRLPRGRPRDGRLSAHHRR